MLIPNLKSEFRKNLKKSRATPKTKKKNDFCSVYLDRNFDPNKFKIFFSCSSPLNYPEKSVLRKKLIKKKFTPKY